MVNFGQKILQAQSKEPVSASGLAEFLNYEELKRILEYAIDWDGSQDSVPDVACLQSDFWRWPNDYEGITSTGKAWLSAVFVKKLRQEINRIITQLSRASTVVTRENKIIRSLESRIHQQSFGENELREIMKLQEDVNLLSSDMREYAILNYTACFKIVKKHDKICPDTPCLAQIMRLVDDQMREFVRPDPLNQSDILVRQTSPVSADATSMKTSNASLLSFANPADSSSNGGSQGDKAKRTSLNAIKTVSSVSSLGHHWLAGAQKAISDRKRKQFYGNKNSRKSATSIHLSNIDKFFDQLEQSQGDDDNLIQQFEHLKQQEKMQIKELVSGQKSQYFSKRSMDLEDLTEDTKKKTLVHAATNKFKSGIFLVTHPRNCCNLLPIVEVVHAGYSGSDFFTDLTSSIIITLAGIPKAMSYAALVGVPVSQGLPTLYIPCLVYALLGTSRQVAISPLSVPCMLLGGLVDENIDLTLNLTGAALTQEKIALSMLYTLASGICIFVFGFLRLGFFLQFISKPVLSGFISASAAIGVLAVIKSLLGVSIKKSPLLHELIHRIANVLPDTHWPTLVISLVCIILMFGLPIVQKHVLKRIESLASERKKRLLRPVQFLLKTKAVLIVVVIGVVLGGFLCDFQTIGAPSANILPLVENNTTDILIGGHNRRLAGSKCSKVKVVGYIDNDIPAPAFPVPETQISIGNLIANGALLAIVALLEHVANVKFYCEKYNYDSNVSQDLVAVGASNILGAVFGSFLVAGGFSRTALNSSAKSQVSLLLSVFISLGVVLALSEVLSMLPDAVLSVILFCSLITLVDYKMVMQLYGLGKDGMFDLLALVVAFLVTCFAGVIIGMAAAIGFSLVTFVFHSTQAEVVELQRALGSMHYEIYLPGHMPHRRSHARILHFQAPLWFANVHRLTDRIADQIRKFQESDSEGACGIVLDMSSVPYIDVTAALELLKYLERAKAQDVYVVFSGPNQQVQEMLTKMLNWDEVGFFAEVFDAASHLESFIHVKRHSLGIALQSGVATEGSGSSNEPVVVRNSEFHKFLEGWGEKDDTSAKNAGIVMKNEDDVF